MSRKLLDESKVHAAAMADIRRQRMSDTGMFVKWVCGCGETTPPGRFILCDYHEGFHDAALAAGEVT